MSIQKEKELVLSQLILLDCLPTFIIIPYRDDYNTEIRKKSILSLNNLCILLE